MEFASSSLVNQMAAALGANVSTNGSTLWPIVLIVIGIPLTFYILHKIIGLFTRHIK